MNRRQAGASLLGLGLMRISLAAPSQAEAALIERLIALVGSSKDVVFIRNGTESKAQDAAKHLRDKYDYFLKDISTANDFIRLCGTRSEMTKKPYQVRLLDGRVLPAAEWLGDQLQRMRASPH